MNKSATRSQLDWYTEYIVFFYVLRIGVVVTTDVYKNWHSLSYFMEFSRTCVLNRDRLLTFHNKRVNTEHPRWNPVVSFVFIETPFIAPKKVS